MRTIRVKIFQVPTWVKWCFMDYEYAKENGFDIKEYGERVAEFDREDYEPEWRVLETIFDFGNRGYIQAVCNNEYMRSISVSDLIMLDDKLYYVDSFGFKEVI